MAVCEEILREEAMAAWLAEHLPREATGQEAKTQQEKISLRVDRAGGFGRRVTVV